MKYTSLFLCFFLSVCASTSSVCPQIRTYSQKEQLNQAAAEDMLPPGSALESPLLEWARLRSELKACNGE